MGKARIFLISVFAVSLSLRLTLSFINRGSNDNHLEVINLIIDNHKIPEKADCWECFQPKFFYLVQAGIIMALHIENKSSRIACVQLFNFILSFFILLFLWKFIKRQKIPPSVQLWCFALVALNPCLLGINIQATNDTAEIFAGVLAVYFTELFLTERKMSSAILMICYTILASLFKGSGIVIMAALVIIFSIKLIFADNTGRRLFGKAFLMLLLLYFAIVPFAGNYYQNYQNKLM